MKIIPDVINFKPEPFEDFQKLTFMNYWTDDLWSLFGRKSASIDISEYYEPLIQLAYDGKTDRPEKIKELEQKINEARDVDFPLRGMFVRLNTRSPKDYTDGQPLWNGEEVVRALTGSMRVVDDLGSLSIRNEPIILYIFAFLYEIQQREFRCFVKDGDLIAVTQYEGTKEKGYPEKNVQKVIKSVKDIYKKVNPCVHLEDYIFDTFIIGDEAYFLEINPYGLSDPCFFLSYENVEKGGFAYQKTEIIDL